MHFHSFCVTVFQYDKQYAETRFSEASASLTEASTILDASKVDFSAGGALIADSITIIEGTANPLPIETEVDLTGWSHDYSHTCRLVWVPTKWKLHRFYIILLLLRHETGNSYNSWWSFVTYSYRVKITTNLFKWYISQLYAVLNYNLCESFLEFAKFSEASTTFNKVIQHNCEPGLKLSTWRVSAGPMMGQQVAMHR